MIPRAIVDVDIVRRPDSSVYVSWWQTFRDRTPMICGRNCPSLDSAISMAVALDPDEIHFKGFTPKENN
jgi:hypothetical protein